MSKLADWMYVTDLDAVLEVAPGWVTALAGSASDVGVRVSAAASSLLPPGAVTASLTNSNVIDRDTLLECMRVVLAAIGRRPQRVAMVIPDLVARVSFVSFEQVPARSEDLDELIRWQVRKSAPFPIEEAVVGHTNVGQSETGGQNFAVVLVRRDVLRQYEETCEALGAQPGLVDIATLATINGIIGAGRGVQGDWLVTHLRPEYTSLAIMRDENLVFFRTKAVAEDESVADLVHQTVMYHRDRLGGQEFTHVFLGGRGRDASVIEAARRSLNSQLGMTIEALDPSASTILPDALDERVVEDIGPAVGMLLRARSEPVAV